MADDAGMTPVPGAAGAGAGANNTSNHEGKPADIVTTVPLHHVQSPLSPQAYTPNPFSRKNTTLEIDDYFVCLPALVPLFPSC